MPAPASPDGALAAVPSITAVPTPSQQQRPALGRVDGLDYPGLHIGNPLTAWGSVQGGVNMIVFSGTGEAYDPNGNYYGMAEICSRTAVWEPKERRDLQHCYYDKRDRHTYTPIGQQGYLTLLRRDDGDRFTFNMRTGALAADRR